MVHRDTTYFVMTTGNTLGSHKTFLDHLTISSNLHEVQSIKQSDVIIAFVPVVSRAGTDIRSAMEIIPKDKPVVLVMLHHTFDPDIVVPDVRCYVNRTDVFVVDCVFHEDQGLLRCLCNDDAIKAVKDHLHSKTVEHTSHPRKVHAACVGVFLGAITVIIIGLLIGVGAGIGAGIFVGIGAGCLYWWLEREKETKRDRESHVIV
ncbi:uncharacterized protein LOC113660615 isoform X9 [Tachysurus fulvidraco]|uniref:uncharacterized protein LOC113660615 isoform X9 n=1 Tax=Tachysurus fulvidraco TaxID=1234273 RepID=UPI001FEF91D5|nr:uncharacterized protein LOC113660615 isoform X9 [Tachysurus fulvidraco]